MRLKYVHEVNGCLYVRRVRTIDGKRVETNARLPAIDAPNFWAEYQRLTGTTPKKALPRNAMTALIADYRASSEFRKGAANTQTNKNRYLDMIEERWGPYDFTTLTGDKVRTFRDEHFATPGKADNLLTTLSALMGWAVKRGRMPINPCAGIERLADGEREPWPQEVMDRALDAASPMLRLAIQAHYYTGQRIGDVIRMTRPRAADERIKVVQEKTGAEVLVPIHRDFWTAIQAIPAPSRVPMPLLYGRDDQLFTADALRDRLRTLMRDLGADYKFHGLRKNAVIALLEAGSTTWEVGSITGQTPEMVEHYARRVNREKLAMSAIAKWESGKP